MMKKRLTSALLVLLLVLSAVPAACLPVLAASGNVSYTYVDCTDTYTDYGIAVAALSDSAETLTVKSFSEDGSSDACSEETHRKSQEESAAKRVLIRTENAMNFALSGLSVVIAGPGHRYTLQFDSASDAEEAVTALKKDSEVLYAEQDEVVELSPVETCSDSGEPTLTVDSVTHNSWGCEKLKVDSLIDYASGNCKDNSVIVAIVDSGVDYTHTFLKDRMVYNADGSIAGYDFSDKDNDPMDENTQNSDGEITNTYHGTHCAGIVADCTQGLNVRILAVRVMGIDGSGYLSDCANGITYAYEHGAKVISCSFGGSTHSSVMDDAVNTAINGGAVICVAAGNESADLDRTTTFPAHITGAITVGAVDSSLTVAYYSNYGSVVDVCAPGSSVLSCKGGSTNGYQTLSGTSMATPHVSACAALLFLLNPDLTSEEVSTKLKESALDLGTSGQDDYYGYGLPQMDYFLPEEEAVELKVGESAARTDSTGNYENSTLTGLDTGICLVTVEGKTNYTEKTGMEKIASSAVVSGNTYAISDGSGHYLVLSGTSLSSTTDPDAATRFTLTSSGSGFTLKSGSYYLRCTASSSRRPGSSSGSLSASATSSVWYYSSTGLYCTVSSVSGWMSGSRTYYLTYSSGWKVSTSSHNAALYQKVTSLVEGSSETLITFTAVSAGSTSVTIGSRTYAITVKANEDATTGTVIVKTVDDAGVTLKADYTLTGNVGTSFTITPEAIDNYVTPDAVTGIYGKGTTQTVTLIYTLNTDKTALKTALDNALTSQGDYTDESWNAYKSAVNAGQTVYDNARAKQTDVDNAVKAIDDAKDALKEKVYTGTVIVKTVDDAGVTLKADYTLTGNAGTSFTVTPEAIDNYVTPDAVTGTYGKGTTQTVTLIYTLNTDKTALKTALDNALTSQGDYTDESWNAYKNAVNAGKTVYDNARAKQTDVDNAVKAIDDAKDALKEKVYTGTVIVRTVDDAGVTLKADYTLTGNAGTSFTVTPEAIDNYLTPDAVTGTYGKGTTQTVTLVYTLNTDKTALKTALDNALTSQGDYTDESWNAYKSAMNAGKTVYDNARAKQTDVDNAVKAIDDAKDALKVRSSGYTLDKDGIDSGCEYVIVSSGYALKCSGSSLTRQAVTSNGTDTIAELDDSCIWILTKSGSGYTLRNKSTGTYLTVSSSRSFFRSSYKLSTSSSAKVWTASVSGSTVTFRTSSRYLVYSSGFTVSSSRSGAMSLYKVSGQ